MTRFLPDRWLPWVVCLLLIHVNAIVSAQDLHIVMRDGTSRAGPLPAPEQWLAASRIGEAPPTACDGAVLLRTGAVLVGMPVAIERDQLVMRSDRFGRIDLPMDQVAGLSFGSAIRDIGAGEPGAVFVNGDAMPGSVAFLDQVNLGLHTGRRIVSIPRSRVAIVRLAPLDTPPAGWRVLANNGDRLLGPLTARGGALVLDAGPGRLDLARGGWSAAWWEGEGSRPATTVPFTGATPAVAIDAFHDGRPLAWRQRIYGRGFAIRGAAQLTWAQPGGGRLIGEAVLLVGETATIMVGEQSLRLRADAAPQSFAFPLTDGTCTVTVSAPAESGSPLVLLGWPLFIPNP